MSEIAQAYQREYTLDAKLKILGTPEHDTAKIAVREMQLPITADEFLQIYKAKVRVVLQRPPLMPGEIFKRKLKASKQREIACRS